MGALGQVGPVLIRFGVWSLGTQTVQLKWQKAYLRLQTFLQIQALHREEEYCLPLGLFSPGEFTSVGLSVVLCKLDQSLPVLRATLTEGHPDLVSPSS